MMSDGGQQRQRRRQKHRRIEQHADRDEEQHGEGVAQRQRLGRGLLAQLRLAQHHAGEEGAERQRNAEQLRRGVGDAERDRQHGQAEQLAAAGMGDIVQDGRDQLLAEQQHDGDEHGELAEQDGDRAHDLDRAGRRLHAVEQRRRVPAAARAPAPWRCLARSASRR